MGRCRYHEAALEGALKMTNCWIPGKEIQRSNESPSWRPRYRGLGVAHDVAGCLSFYPQCLLPPKVGHPRRVEWFIPPQLGRNVSRQKPKLPARPFLSWPQMLLAMAGLSSTGIHCGSMHTMRARSCVNQSERWMSYSKSSKR